jgi:hypothetical protein
VNETELLQELQQARQLAPRVVFVEGPTDLPVFFGLIGIPRPRLDVHDGVLVKALSGRSRVRAMVELAARSGIRGIFGITDGDGEPLATLTASFAPPFAGPLFRWPTYAIENLLVKTGWPPSWGAAPDWSQVLLDHVPYVALNALVRELRQSLRTLRLAAFAEPKLQERMKTAYPFGRLRPRSRWTPT